MSSAPILPPGVFGKKRKTTTNNDGGEAGLTLSLRSILLFFRNLLTGLIVLTGGAAFVELFCQPICLETSTLTPASQAPCFKTATVHHVSSQLRLVSPVFRIEDKLRINRVLAELLRAWLNGRRQPAGAPADVEGTLSHSCRKPRFTFFFLSWASFLPRWKCEINPGSHPSPPPARLHHFQRDIRKRESG